MNATIDDIRLDVLRLIAGLDEVYRRVMYGVRVRHTVSDEQAHQIAEIAHRALGVPAVAHVRRCQTPSDAEIMDAAVALRRFFAACASDLRINPKACGGQIAPAATAAMDAWERERRLP